MNSPRGATALIVLILLGATLLFTWPLPTRLTRELPAYDRTPDEDLLSNIWAVWWTKASLVEGRDSLFYTRSLFFPDGTPLTMSAISVASTVPVLPATILLPGLDGIFLGWNLNLLATFFLSGVSTFLLARKVSGSVWAGLAAGLIFAFCPYRFDHLRHVNLSCTQWIPLVFWTLLRFLETPTLGRSLPLAASLALVAASSSTYATYLVVIVPLFLAGWFLPRLWGGVPVLTVARQLVELSLPLSMAVLLALPVLLPMATDALFVEFETPTDEDPVHFAYPLETFFLRKAPCYIGNSVALLSTYALAKVPGSGPWALVALAGAALAPGPTLKTASGVWPVSLPYDWIRRLFPPLKNNRFCERFLVFWWLGASILAAQALLVLGRSRPILCGLMAASVFLDLRPETLATDRPKVPGVYERLSAAPSSWPVYEWPADYLTNRRFMYFQMVHQRPICQGHLSRRSVASYQTERYDMLSDLPAMILVVHRDYPADRFQEHRLSLLFDRYKADFFAREASCEVWLLRRKAKP